jgi:peptidoglycan hydrolase-like protein with peptidoglycan-binding domain
MRALIALVPAAALFAPAVVPAAQAASVSGAGLTSQAGGIGLDPYHHLGGRALSRGARGHDVKVAQDYLRRAGFATKVDGVYGAGTIVAVRHFETANGVRADGVLTKANITLLRGFVEKGFAMRAKSPTVAATPDTAGLNADGTATAPVNAPPAVAAIIAAGNVIATRPYVYGGGHDLKWSATDPGYDCSGSVSFALHGANLLKTPLASGDLMSWGAAGPGSWVTIYANGGHVFMVVAGLRFDTSGRSRTGSRWQSDMRSPRGYTIRHPVGL